MSVEFLSERNLLFAGGVIDGNGERESDHSASGLRGRIMGGTWIKQQGKVLR